LASLKRAGLVKSKNGNKGGLKLALSLNKITLFDIYRGIQSDHFVAIHSNPENKKCPVSRQIKPILDGVLQSTEAAIDESLKRRTLADLIHEIKRREKI
jgi:DNA-binding IscR family transcriptional regulator